MAFIELTIRVNNSIGKFRDDNIFKVLFLPINEKSLPEGTGPPEWTQQPQISVSLQEGEWVYLIILKLRKFTIQ